MIKSEPDLTLLPAEVPSRVRQVIRRCLQKESKERFQHIGDVRLALEGAFETAATISGRPVDRTRRTAIVAAIAVIFGLAASVAALWPRLNTASVASPAVNRFTVPVPAGSLIAEGIPDPLAIAPNGRHIVLNVTSGGTGRVYVRSLDELQWQQLSDTGGSAANLFLSPDGGWIGFYDPGDGRLKRIKFGGGPVSTIGSTGVTGNGFGGATWGRSGVIAFSTLASDTLLQVPEGGGTQRSMTTAADRENHRQAHFLPDGRSLLFVVQRGSESQIAYLPPEGGSPVLLTAGTSPRYVGTGHILFTRDGAIWAVPFDARRGRLLGEPVRVLEEVSINLAGVSRLAVSDNGTLVYVPGAGRAARTIVRVDRTGREQTLAGLKPDNYENIRVSPDGGRLLYDVGQPRDVWTYDLARGTTERLTSADGDDRYAIWTPDGTRIVYMSTRNGNPEIFSQPVDRADAAERLVSSQGTAPTRLQPEAWANGASTLIVSDAAGGSDVAVVELDGARRVSPFGSRTRFREGAGALSPNGRWIAYQSDFTGSFEVHVERFPEATDRQKISLDGGYAPRWSQNGRELFYVSTTGQRVVAVPIREQGSRLVPGAPTTLFEGAYLSNSPGLRPFDVMPDGSFVLIRREMAQIDEGRPAIVVVENWFEELKRLVPVN